MEATIDTTKESYWAAFIGPKPHQAYSGEWLWRQIYRAAAYRKRNAECDALDKVNPGECKCGEGHAACVLRGGQWRCVYCAKATR